MQEWDLNDYRLWVGNLGDEITDYHLEVVFNKYPSFLKAKVVRGRMNSRTKGYGFISFKDSRDYIKAFKEMNGRYIGKKPIVLKVSDWKKRIIKKKNK